MLRGAKDELLDFVSERNAAAALALESRPDAQQSFHRLALHVTFLSTDLMQRCCATGGEAMGNLKRWSGKEDMIPRLVASGLMWVEAGFRRIRHAEDLTRRAAALRAPRLAPCPSAKSMMNLTPTSLHRF